MFEHLSEHKKIVVSGPPRSGTWITSKMIAQDTGHELIPEKRHGYYRWPRFVELLAGTARPSVIHAPSLTSFLHKMIEEDAEVFIVFVVRSPNEIAASERRINKTRVIYRLTQRQYAGIMPVPKIASCMARYAYWFSHQRYVIPAARFVEIRYESLADHPLWVPKQRRRHFATHQTVANQPDPHYLSQGYGP